MDKLRLLAKKNLFSFLSISNKHGEFFMTNINNNKNINTNSIAYNSQNVAKKSVNDAPIEVQAAQAAEKSSQEYSAILGRSQVKFSSKSDNLEKDVASFVNNPSSVKKANTFFDIAYAQACQQVKSNPYEYAALLAKEFYNESVS